MNRKRSFMTLLLIVLLAVGAVAAGLTMSSVARKNGCVGRPVIEEPDTRTSSADVSYSDEEDETVPLDVECGQQVLFIGRTRSIGDYISGSDAAMLEGMTVSGQQPDIVAVSGTDVTALSVGDVKLDVSLRSGDTYHIDIQSRKCAYLTFDDFPNQYTPRILDTLKEKNAVGTFFLCHATKEEVQYLYKRIQDEGHALGNHTGSHKPTKLFQNVYTLIAGFQRMEEFYETMGVRTKLVRMPMGTADPYRKEIRKSGMRRMYKMGYAWVDWTASTEDSYCRKESLLMNNLKKTCTEDREIVLMHNIEGCANYLGEMIDWMREQGYEFERIDDAPQVYAVFYGWYDNPCQRGAGRYTSEMLSGNEFSC